MIGRNICGLWACFMMLEVPYFVTMLIVDFSLELPWAWVRSGELYSINLMRLLQSVDRVFCYTKAFSFMFFKTIKRTQSYRPTLRVFSQKDNGFCAKLMVRGVLPVNYLYFLPGIHPPL